MWGVTMNSYNENRNRLNQCLNEIHLSMGIFKEIPKQIKPIYEPTPNKPNVMCWHKSTYHKYTETESDIEVPSEERSSIPKNCDISYVRWVDTLDDEEEQEEEEEEEEKEEELDILEETAGTSQIKSESVDLMDENVPLPVENEIMEDDSLINPQQQQLQEHFLIIIIIFLFIINLILRTDFCSFVPCMFMVLFLFIWTFLYLLRFSW